MFGTDTAQFHPGFKDPSVWERYEGVNPEAVKALYVGRITNEKNVPFLLETWKRMMEARPASAAPIQLVLVGEGKHRRRQRELAPYGIVFLGPRLGEELSTLYASSDFFLFPSVTDTLGQVVMEAQASGLPVVVADKGGPGILVNRDGMKTGMVVPGNDSDAWQKAIETLSDDPDLRRELGRAARETMERIPIRNSYQEFWKVHQNAAKG